MDEQFLFQIGLDWNDSKGHLSLNIWSFSAAKVGTDPIHCRFYMVWGQKRGAVYPVVLASDEDAAIWIHLDPKTWVLLTFFLQTGTLWHRCFLKKSMSTHPGWRRGEYAENTRRMTAGIACIASRVAPQTWLMKFASKDGQRYSLQIFILKSVPISSVWSWLQTFNHWWVLSLHLEFLLPGARFGLGGSFENRTWL